VIDHHRQVSLTFAVGDLIDPDPPQAGEQIATSQRLGGDSGADPPTLHQAILISPATAVWEQFTASHAA
jgi:hypothetical protein